jgi:hypothetical protein
MGVQTATVNSSEPVAAGSGQVRLLRFECLCTLEALAQRSRRARRRGWTCFSGCVCVLVLTRGECFFWQAAAQMHPPAPGGGEALQVSCSSLSLSTHTFTQALWCWLWWALWCWLR